MNISPIKLINKIDNRIKQLRIKNIHNETFVGKMIIHSFSNKDNLKLNHCNNRPTSLPEVIVSLTSYGDRIRSVNESIESILSQYIRPDRVILYLDEESNSIPIPDELINLQRFGLEIVRGVKNLKCHNKYYYAMQHYKDSIIITIDDDCIYPPNTVSTLLEGYLQHPQAVIARRVHRITKDRAGRIAPYVKWDHEWNYKKGKPCMDLFATGCAGVLYPPHILPQYCFDEVDIERNSLLADDIWLKCVEVSSGIPTVNVGCSPYSFITIDNTQKRTLKSINVGENFHNGNDTALQNCLRALNINHEDFFR